MLQHLLRQRRRERSLLQRELASKLNKPTSFICHMEKGNVMLDMPQLRQFCQALGLTLRELVDRYEADLGQKE
ncbi:MAG: helix-turn-helix domain-containing protein [Janthinobacterium lividum]